MVVGEAQERKQTGKQVRAVEDTDHSRPTATTITTSWLGPLVPSSWMLPELRHLAAQPGVTKHQVDQCTCGVDYKKPTTLLAVRCEELGQELARLPGGGRCHSSLGHQHKVLRGRTAKGHWATAPAKQYPARLCETLDTALARAAARRLVPFAGRSPAGLELPAELEGLVAPLPEAGAAWGSWRHDCAGGAA